MKKRRANQIAVIALILAMFLTSMPVLAQDNGNQKSNNTHSNAATPHLSEEQNPLMVGKRDINKHQINFYSLDKEVGLGQQMAAQVAQQTRFINDPVITEYVNRVGQNIVLNSDAKVPFTIRVVDSEEVNAFALPGGFFFVNKGLILAADNESELVGVMAHEIAHVCARHGTEQASKGKLLQYGSLPLIFLGGPIGLGAQAGAGLLLPATFLKFSRNAESEADMLGAQYAWASGYDPMGMVAMFEKLAAKEKKKSGSMSKLFADHPATGDRAIAVRNLITKFPKRDNYVVNTSDFDMVKARLQGYSGGSPRNIARNNGNNGNNGNRPTLSRRNGNNAPDLDPNNTSSSQPQDRPTLKRRDDSSSTPDLDPANTTSQQPQDRPILKRRDDSNVDNNSAPPDPDANNSAPAAPKPPPTLKRRDGIDYPGNTAPSNDPNGPPTLKRRDDNSDQNSN